MDAAYGLNEPQKQDARPEHKENLDRSRFINPVETNSVQCATLVADAPAGVHNLIEKADKLLGTRTEVEHS